MHKGADEIEQLKKTVMEMMRENAVVRGQLRYLPMSVQRALYGQAAKVSGIGTTKE